MTLSIFRRILFAMALTSLAVAASALAPTASGASTGGSAMPDEPKVVAAVCEDASEWRCARGARLTLGGESLGDVQKVRFVGRRGRRDDRVAKPRRAADDALEVVVPADARSGRIAVVGGGGRGVTPQRVKVTRRATRRAVPGEGVFPIAGPHRYGTYVNHFGGGRGHQGEDVFAKCGTPLVALYDAKVQHRATHSRAGNYVVLQTADGASYAYMHLQSPTPLRKGATVRAGDPVGKVGETGRASGCHLHFEQWTAPGWYEGGKPIDPLPLLRSLDRKR